MFGIGIETRQETWEKFMCQAYELKECSVTIIRLSQEEISRLVRPHRAGLSESVPEPTNFEEVVTTIVDSSLIKIEHNYCR